MTDYQSSYTGAQVDAATTFGHDPDTEPHLNSQVGVTSDGIYQADRALEAKIVNRNLLNNPYFRIDQRQGSVVPPNTPMFESGTTNTWTTDGYYQVTNWHYDASTPPIKYADIVVNGTTWSCSEAYIVRGYVAIGGSTTRINDRWAIWIADGGNGGVVILNNDDGTFTVKRISGTHSTVADNFSVFYRMSAEETKGLRAQTVTISSKTDLGDLIFQHDVPSSGTTDSGYKFYPDSSPWALQFTIDNSNQGAIAINGYYVPLNSEITFSANKLELGSISTLQAEMDSGYYDYNEDLRNCRKYFRRIKGENPSYYSYAIIGRMFAFQADSAVYSIPSSGMADGVGTISIHGSLTIVGNGQRWDNVVPTTFNTGYTTTECISGQFVNSQLSLVPSESYDIALFGNATTEPYIDISKEP